MASAAKDSELPEVERQIRDVDRRIAAHCGHLFDVLVIDPPWKVASANPTRGVAINQGDMCFD